MEEKSTECTDTECCSVNSLNVSDILNRITRLEELVNEICTLDVSRVLQGLHIPSNTTKCDKNVNTERERRLKQMEHEIEEMINDQNELKDQQDQLLLTFEEALKQQESIGKQQIEELTKQQQFRNEFQKYIEHKTNYCSESVCSTTNTQPDPNCSRTSRYNLTECSYESESVKREDIQIKKETSTHDDYTCDVQYDSSMANQAIVNREINHINLKHDICVENFSEKAVVDPLNIIEEQSNGDVSVCENNFAIEIVNDENKNNEIENIIEFSNKNEKIGINDIKICSNVLKDERISNETMKNELKHQKTADNNLQNQQADMQLSKQVDLYLKSLRSGEGDAATDSTTRSKSNYPNQISHKSETKESEKCKTTKRKGRNFTSETDESFEHEMKANPRKRRKIECENARRPNRPTKHNQKLILPRTTHLPTKNQTIQLETKGLPPMQECCMSVCSTTIWIGRLSKNVTRNDIFDIFGEFGKVTSVILMKEKECAFICMSRRTDSCKALRKLSKTKVLGEHSKVDWAPGKGMRGKVIWKSFWNLLYGTFYIPHHKIGKDTELSKMQDGSIFDMNTVPNWMKLKEGPSNKSKQGIEKSSYSHERRRNNELKSRRLRRYR